MKDNCKKTLIKNSFFVSLIVCLGKIFGFLKQAVIAWAFGANAGTDIYFAADSYIAMIGQIQSSSISPCVLTEYISLNENKKRTELENLIKLCFIIFPLISILLILINILLSGNISSVLGISYSFEQRKELKKFIIYLCPVILFTSFAGVSNAILDANGRFIPSRLLSLFFSTSIIVSLIIFQKKFGINSLLLGFLFGYGVHTIYVTILTKKYFTLGRINTKVYFFQKLIKNIIPIVIGNSIVDIGHLVDKIVASSLVTGSVSYLYYGQVISSDLVCSVVITTIGSVLFPSLTKMVTNDCDGKKIAERISTILNKLIALLVGIISLYIVEGTDLVKLFFQRGEFSSVATSNVSDIAICYAIGFVFIAIREILTKTYYAYQDTKTPMIIGVLGVIINVILSLILSKIIGIAGVALATSVSIAIISVIMCITIKKHISVFPLCKEFFVALVKCLIAGIVIVFAGFFLSNIFENYNYIIRMIIISVSMIILYGIILKILKHEILLEIKHILKKKDNRF